MNKIKSNIYNSPLFLIKNNLGVSGVIVSVLLVLVGLAAVALVALFVIDFSKGGLEETSNFEGFGDDGNLVYSNDGTPVNSDAPDDDDGSGGSSGSGGSGNVDLCEGISCEEGYECREGKCYPTGDGWTAITECDDYSKSFYNIRESGNYYLANDLESRGDGNCLNVNNLKDVVIDGLGHKITGKKIASETSGVNFNYIENGVIKNLFIDRYVFCGLSIKYSSNNVFSNLILFNNSEKGICLDFSLDNTFSDINASNNGISGLYLYRSEENGFLNIVANNNSAGLILQGSSNNRLSNLNLSKNSIAGIVLFDSSLTNSFLEVLSENNDYGFYFLDSSSNSISESVICNNLEGDFYCVNSNDLTGENNYLDSIGDCGDNIVYTSCNGEKDVSFEYSCENLDFNCDGEISQEDIDIIIGFWQSPINLIEFMETNECSYLNTYLEYVFSEELYNEVSVGDLIVHEITMDEAVGLQYFYQSNC